ncbi:Myblike DNAbinding domain-containing protein [Mortierella alpina]|nr:Myblike DNAbinding domain-containing protein [Mortierella alpina]
MDTHTVGSGSNADPVALTPEANLPAGVADNQDQELSTVQEVDTATHIVVEHLRTGTVKTHVFASKNGQPSLLGHVIPDTTCTSDVLGPLLDVKIQALQDLVETSLETTRSESLSMVEHLAQALETRESMVATQVSLAVTTTIEHQIKTELTPQLDKIEKLLSLRNLKDATTTTAASSSPPSSSSPDIPSPKSETASKSSSLDHLNQDDATDAITSTCSPKGSPGAESVAVNAEGSATLAAGGNSVVLEKLETIEHQVGALCKVVIDGHIPPLDSMVPGSGTSDGGKQTRTLGHHSEGTSFTSKGATTAAVADNAHVRLAAMRDEMLNIPETLSGANAKMQELIDVMARTERLAAGPRTIDAAVSTEDENQLEAIHRELKEWKENLESYMIAHQAGLGNVDSQVQIVESEVRAMDADHQAWKKTHQQSLSVYLKYMYHVYKRTATVDGHIQQVLEHIQHHTGLEQEQRTKFAEDLASMRSEILSILHSLPDTVANALKRSNESSSPSHSESVCAAQASAVGEATSYVPERRSMLSELASGPVHGAESQVLGMPASENTTAKNAGGPQQDTSQSDSRTPTPLPGSNPDPILEKLVQTVESLQASIASMIDQYSEFTAMIAASPPPPAPSEIPEPPPREPAQVEHRIRILEDLLFQMNQSSSTRRSVQDGCASHCEILPEMGHPGTRTNGGPPPPPAPGYSYSRSRNSSTSENASEAAMTSNAAGALPHQQPEAASISPSDFRAELESMSKNLTELVNVVTVTTSRLSDGQNYLHHELCREIQRVVDTIHPPETEEDQLRQQELSRQEQLAETERLKNEARMEQEAALEAEHKRLEDEKAAAEAEALARVAAEERAQALEYIALIPHIMTTLESGRMERGGNVDEAMIDELKESRAAVAKVEAAVEGCHADVQNILQGCIQDSSVLAMIQEQVDGISNGIHGASNIVLKNHMEEVLRTGANVFLMMEDVKAIGSQTLAQQQILGQRLDEWHLRQEENGSEVWAQRTDQGLQSLDRKQDLGLRELQAIQHTLAETAAQMNDWHGRHDRDLRDLSEWRHRNYDDIQAWHLKLESELEAWHRKHEEGLHKWHTSHDERLQALEKSYCHSCLPRATLEASEARASAGEGPVTDSSSRAIPPANSVPGSGSYSQEASHLRDHLSVPGGSVDQSRLDQSLGACCGESAAAGFPYDSNPARHRAREMFEEFLHNVIPGPNTSCLACGHLCGGTAPDCSSFQGSCWTSGIIMPEPLPQTFVAADNDAGPCTSGAGEGVSSHSKGVESQTNGCSTDKMTLGPKATLPQELHALTRPYTVHDDGGNMTDDAALDKGSARSQEGEASIKKELAELQMKHDELLRASQDSEETLSRFMTSVMQKNLELATLQDEKCRLETEREALRMAMEQQLTAHQEAMARRKYKLNARKATIERLYREGLGLSTTDRADEAPEPAVPEDNDPASDADSVDTVEIPRYSLMNEAAAQLRQALDELKMQKAALYYDIRTLEDRKIHLVEDVAKTEKVFRTDDAVSSAASQRGAQEAEKEKATERAVQGPENARQSEDSDDDYADEADTRSRPTAREDRGSSRAGSRAGGPRSRTLTRQQRRLSHHAGRGVSMAPTRSRGKRGDRREEKVPQLEADIQICKDGILSETLLSSKTILTEEQFERIRTTRVEAGEKESAREEDEVWSLNCDFRVKMHVLPGAALGDKDADHDPRAPTLSQLTSNKDNRKQDNNNDDSRDSNYSPSSSGDGSGESSSSSSSHSQQESGAKASSEDSDTLKYRKPQFTPEIDQEILRLRKQGLSWPAIGSALGLPHRSCHRRFVAGLDPGLQELWPEERVKRLDELVAQGKPWSEIAKDLGTSSSSCQAKWKSVTRPKDRDRNRQFDLLQSKVLLQLVEEHGEDNWKAVMRGFMMQLGGRDMAKVTPEQLRHQYYKLLRRPTRVWSLNEETALIQHVLKHGTGKWDEISQALRHHSPEQCKEKWLTLDMTTKIPKEKAWYKAERGNFWRLWQRYGENWTLVAAALPGRTAAQCEALFKRETARFPKDDLEAFQQRTKALAEEMSQHKCYVWKKEESDRLWEVAEECRGTMSQGRIMWSKVAEKMQMDLKPEQMKHHHYYLRTVRAGGLGGLWREDEVKKLEQAVREVGRNWRVISKQYLPGRNPKSISHKFYSIRNKGSHISEKEYDVLMSSVDQQEQEFNRRYDIADSSSNNTGSSPRASSLSSGTFTPNWHEIARSMPGAWTAEDCRNAYEHSFMGHLKNSKWTPAEDEALLQATKDLGRKNWIGIARSVPGKDTWECRLRWSELQKPVLEKDAADIEAKSVKRHPTMHLKMKEQQVSH